jgi:HK97 gp10 family phage protein
MNISIQVKGLQKALDTLKRAERSLEQPIMDTLKGGAQLIRGEAIKSIQTGSKTGRLYKRYNPTRTHRASAPGEAPASDTGNLVSNIMVEDNKDSVEVQSKAEYSKFLEYGTSKMEARPYMFPAYEKSKDKIIQAVFRKIAQTLQDLAK